LLNYVITEEKMSNLSFEINQSAIQLIRDPNVKYPIGTGFCFIRPDWIATAKHVVILHGIPRQNLEVVFTDGISRRAEVYAWHPEIDIAILRLLDPGLCKIPLFPAYVRFTGKQGLISAGYKPSSSQKDERLFSIVVNCVETWEIEHRSRINSEEEIIIFPSDIEQGHSGGPLFGQGGGVVGIVIEIFEQEGKSYARGTSILSLLDGIEIQRDWQNDIINS
jgi:hypothetical protein